MTWVGRGTVATVGDAHAAFDGQWAWPVGCNMLDLYAKRPKVLHWPRPRTTTISKLSKSVASLANGQFTVQLARPASLPPPPLSLSPADTAKQIINFAGPIDWANYAANKWPIMKAANWQSQHLSCPYTTGQQQQNGRKNETNNDMKSAEHSACLLKIGNTLKNEISCKKKKTTFLNWCLRI